MTKILIVEDEPGIRETLAAGLKMKGFETVVATNGEEGINAALTQHPDLILLDVVMPKVSGLDVCRKLKNTMQEFVPIIMVTAKADVKDKIEGANRGADDYLTKPFKIEELMTRITAMLRIKAQHDDLKKISLTDYLTGTYNRRFLQTRIKEEYSRAQRHGTPFTCLMLDLDNFKPINDKYGHAVGDKVLKHVVELVRKFIRPTDVFVRYGGDEFVLLLPETPLESARGLAERIRHSLETNRLVDGENIIQVGCSIGLGTFPGPDADESEDLLKKVDQMLYQAKKNGRNQISVYNHDLASPK
jgi:two-component system, cell cycle response regulator